MEAISKQEILDIRRVRWGAQPAPLLPRSLRAAWAYDQLPDWASAEAGLPISATVADLGPEVWGTLRTLSKRLQHYLQFLVRTRIAALGETACFDRRWPAGLKISDIAWQTRTRNCLERSNLLNDPQQLTNLTFNHLSVVHRIGALGVVDFCATLEGAMDLYAKLAAELGVGSAGRQADDPISALLDIASQEWAAQVSETDPRFRSLLPGGHGTLQDRIERLLPTPDTSQAMADALDLLGRSRTIQQRIEALSREPLEQALMTLLHGLSGAEGSRLDTIAMRLGWTGTESLTLRECSERLGVTRERVRQIQIAVLKRIPEHEIFMPQLDAALELLEEIAPVSADEAMSRLRNSGITRCDFHPRSLLEAASLLRKTTSLSLVGAGGHTILGSDEGTKLVQLVSALARKYAAQSGVTSVFRILDGLEARGHTIGEDHLKAILHSDPQCAFLTEDWLSAQDSPARRNRLLNVARKVLSVAAPQTVVSIRDAARRNDRARTYHPRYAGLVLPPLDVVESFFSRQEGLRVADGLVYSLAPLDYTRELRETERIMVDVLRSSPAGVLDRSSFLEGCRARGMNENTFSQYTSYSAILDHVGTDIWKLRGVMVDPAAVEAVRISNHLQPRERRVLGHGWSEDGKLWVAARIPHTGATSLVIGCPGPIRRYLSGRDFECRVKETHHRCGTIGINEKGASYGYGSFIGRYGLDEGDILLAEFDLLAGTVDLSVGSENLLDGEL
jgi:hypothetical protein